MEEVADNEWSVLWLADRVEEEPQVTECWIVESGWSVSSGLRHRDGPH